MFGNFVYTKLDIVTQHLEFTIDANHLITVCQALNDIFRDLQLVEGIWK
jgi:hypothetical protein